MIKHRGHVLHVELVSRIAEKKVSLTDPGVAHEYYIESFKVSVGLGIERTDSTEIIRNHFVHYYNLYCNNYILYGVVYFTLIKTTKVFIH